MNNKIRKPIISVIICTFNNSNSLFLTLNQLLYQKFIDYNDFEVIIVNNNSGDNTNEICQNFIGNNVKYFFEKSQGLSFARNTGVYNSSGEYLLFTDDDAEIPENWLNEYLKMILEYSPDCLFSKINVIWNKQRPWWFLPVYLPYFVNLDYGNNVLHIKDYEHEFYGKNFCIKKTLIEEMGKFNPKLGRCGTTLAAGEETVVYKYLVNNKKEIIYFPSALVGHRLKDKEYEEAHIQKLFLDGAVSSFYMSKQFSRHNIMGKPVKILLINFIKIVSYSILFLFYSVKNEKKLKFYYLLNFKKSCKFISYWMMNYEK